MILTITNNNIYRSEFSFASLSRLENIDTVDINDITYFFSDFVELGESVTFKRLFDIVSANLNKFNEIFYSALGGYSLEPFLQEIENNQTELVESQYLEVRWSCERFEDDFSLYPDFHGVSKNDSYALDFTSLNNIKYLIIKLNTSINFYDYKKKKLDKSVYLGEKLFTLFDLYYAILNEITFHGGPLDKKHRLDELTSIIEEHELELEGKDESNYMTFEEMMDNFDKNDNYLVKYKKLRDRVDESRITNPDNLNNLKKCLKDKLKVFDKIEKSKDNDLHRYYKILTDIEYNMQLLYGEKEDISFHRFWETPKCTCPKIDNLEIYPSVNPVFDDKCPIHGK